MNGSEERKSQIYVYIILFMLIVLGFLLRLPSVTYNLPVASHVDERVSIGILYGFNKGSLNPKWFGYPTFYYYLTHFVTKPFVRDAQEIVLYGRVVNLLLGCFLIVGVFLFAKYALGSSQAGLIASLLAASSPILIKNGGYITVGILLAMLSLFSLLFLFFFFKGAKYKYWFIGVLMAGLALSTKYTAIPVVLAYIVYEFFFRNSTDSVKDSGSLLERQFSPWWLSGGVLAIGILCLACYFFFPSYDWILSVIQQYGTVDSVLDPEDIAAIENLKSKFLILGILSGVVFLLSLRFKAFFARFCYLRPYLGLILMLLFFVLASPFLLISWQQTIYDAAVMFKAIGSGSDERQWLSFVGCYLRNESIIALAFLPIGIYWFVKHKKPLILLAIYLVFSFVSYGSGYVVFARYWTPMLPAMFVISAYGVYATAKLFKGVRWRYVGFLLLVIVCVGLELQPKYCSIVARRTETNSAYGAYHWILDKEPGRVYYSPYAPSVELRMRGFDLKRVPEVWITTDDPSLLQQMGTDDVLMIDGRLESQMSATLGQKLVLEWSSEKDYGQYIYQKK